MATVVSHRPDFTVDDLPVDIYDLTAGGLEVETMTGRVNVSADVDGERRLQLDVARPDRKIVATACGGSLVGCGTMPKPIGCCCS